jgi:signal peptidase I
MSDDDWWTEAVDRFGLDTLPEPNPTLTPASPSTSTVWDPSNPSKRRRKRHPAIDWVVIAVVALTVAVLLRTFVVQQFAVDGQSMLGTLHSGDRVLVNKLSYDLHDPRHGDIVVLEDTKDSLQVRDLIKRVIALPGETVEYRDCQLFIDGERIEEPYLDPNLVTPDRCGDAQDAVEVEPRHVFVMGDNRSASLDSRTLAIGQISYDHLIGRAFVVVWPTADWRWL